MEYKHEDARMNYALKAARRHEIDLKLRQHHLSGGGGGGLFPANSTPRGEIHDTRGDLFFFWKSIYPGGGEIPANASGPKR